MRAARIDQHDAAVTPAGRAFDKLTERFEYSRHRMAARHHFQASLFPCQQGLGPLAIFDVRVLSVPLHEMAGLVTQRNSPDQKPSKHPVEST